MTFLNRSILVVKKVVVFRQVGIVDPVLYPKEAWRTVSGRVRQCCSGASVAGRVPGAVVVPGVVGYWDMVRTLGPPRGMGPGPVSTLVLPCF